jgi:hypothetical protein
VKETKFWCDQVKETSSYKGIIRYLDAKAQGTELIITASKLPPRDASLTELYGQTFAQLKYKDVVEEIVAHRLRKLEGLSHGNRGDMWWRWGSLSRGRFTASVDLTRLSSTQNRLVNFLQILTMLFLSAFLHDFEQSAMVGVAGKALSYGTAVVIVGALFNTSLQKALLTAPVKQILNVTLYGQ